MTARDLLRFLFGFEDSIRAVATSRAALPTAVVLVLITAVPRSYDQTWIGETPFLWFFGPLLFSLVSGTWFFLVVYAGFVRPWWDQEDRIRSVWRDWPAFMGLFWMTAPCAWLYALPVESFFDDVVAAKWNVALLAFVSVWRVALFTRVVQVVTRAIAAQALVWVLIAACLEAFVILFLAQLGPAIARGMGGLRHSPAEEVVLGAVRVALIGSLMIGIPAILVGLFWGPKQPLCRLATRRPVAIPVRPLIALVVFWSGVAVVVQPSLRRSAELDRLNREKDYREVLDLMVRHGPEGFAPARPLPPNPTDWRGVRDARALVSLVRAEDPDWVRRHLERRLDEIFDGVLRFRGVRGDSETPTQEQVAGSFDFVSMYSEDLTGFASGLATNSWLSSWRAKRHVWLSGLARSLEERGTDETRRAAALVKEALEQEGGRASGSTP